MMAAFGNGGYSLKYWVTIIWSLHDVQKQAPKWQSPDTTRIGGSVVTIYLVLFVKHTDPLILNALLTANQTAQLLPVENKVSSKTPPPSGKEWTGKYQEEAIQCAAKQPP